MRIDIDLFIEDGDTPRYMPPQTALPTGVVYISSRAKLYLPDSRSEALRYVVALTDALLVARDTLMFPDSEDTTPTVVLPKSDTLHNGTYE